MSEAEKPSDETKSCGNACCGIGALWRLPLLLAVVLAVVIAANRAGIRQWITTTGRDSTAEMPAPRADGKTVALAIDAGDADRSEWSQIPWHDGMTVADALTAAARSPNDAIEFAQQGTGQSALLIRIGDKANEGPDGRNWMYDVNGEHADRSFAIYQLQPGDKVLWKFGELQ